MSGTSVSQAISDAIKFRLPMYWQPGHDGLLDLLIVTEFYESGRDRTRCVKKLKYGPALELSLELLRAGANLEVSLFDFKANFNPWKFGWDPKLSSLKDQVYAERNGLMLCDWDGWRACKAERATAKR